MRIAACLLGLFLAPPTMAEAVAWQPYSFEANEEAVNAERGYLPVPARYDQPDGPQIELAMVRFPSTNPNPGHTIVYLAGGPGGSGIGTARGPRFPLFMALREVADVIALDQRGTGDSEPGPVCEGDEGFDPSQSMDRAQIKAYAQRLARYCVKFWDDQGYDWRKFTTVASAHDIEALRQALGADKLSLWGISYGTHLALATMRLYENRIHRAVLASPEGMAQTVKLPAFSDAYFERVANVLASDPEASARYPDYLGELRKLLTSLAQEPIAVPVPIPGTDDTAALSIGAEELRILIAFGMIKNPQDVARLPALVYGIKAQGPGIVAPMLMRFLSQPMRLSPMSFAMDTASGISTDRMRLVEEQAAHAVVGDLLNFPMPHVVGIEGLPDLGDAFRQEVVSDIPALILTGTLDGRTFPEEHAQVLAGLRNGRQIVIENAGHDLFMASPEVTDAIRAFLLAQDDNIPDRIVIDPPAWQ